MTVFMYLIVTINVLILFFLHRFYIFMSLHKPKVEFEIGLWNTRLLEFILLELKMLNDKNDRATRDRLRDDLIKTLEKELKEHPFIKYEGKKENEKNT